MVKKYLLWAGDCFYPRAALGDYAGSFDSIEEAVAEGGREGMHSRVYDWYSVVDHETMTEVTYG